MKIIITENQLRLINEAVGVPDGILKAGEELYNIVSNVLKSINKIKKEYKFKISDKKLQISDMILKKINIIVNVEEIEDYDEKPQISTIGVTNTSVFDNTILMNVNVSSKTLDLIINFVVSDDWKPEELLEEFQKDETKTISIMAHELKHRYDKTKKTKGFLGNVADYQTYSSSNLNFGIPIINKFMRYSYYIQGVENLVRPTEISSRMIKKGITKDQFYDFITNDISFIELKEIKNFSFDYLTKNLYNEMDSIEGLLNHAGLSYEELKDTDEKTKINMVLKLVYINLANSKMTIFDDHFYNQLEQLANMVGMPINLNVEKENVRNKFINHVTKYQDREIDFFEDECERFNYVATNLIKKISKIYSLIPDEKEQTNESILNWELHQRIMEKRYGKRKIETKYNNWNFKK